MIRCKYLHRSKRVRGVVSSSRWTWSKREKAPANVPLSSSSSCENSQTRRLPTYFLPSMSAHFFTDSSNNTFTGRSNFSSAQGSQNNIFIDVNAPGCYIYVQPMPTPLAHTIRSHPSRDEEQASRNIVFPFTINAPIQNGQNHENSGRQNAEIGREVFRCPITAAVSLQFTRAVSGPF